jgi:hypothetical protein
MKIAINTDWGGFCLSKQAFERLLERKNIQYTDQNVISEYSFYRERGDRDLIAVIEEFGERANGFGANIAIVEIPDDVEWEISEYDGIEHVAEKHRRWYGK